ncbi:unnamed protein product [Adineta steineri]|uniref:Uncharacterized protein n=1 Tax=Adineta steineri TaxID=433720 RepID=A0A813W4M5_9BILA|nr:unnamed protein product [Adineta steineri]CAF3768353.1 unnamed protein product [Adineta steineri]
MDADTIFSNLPYGENVVGKYEYSECFNSVKTTCILTNLRLLIRWKETFLCCCHQSHYSAIRLKSISRIDETRPSRYNFIIGVILFIIGLISSIFWKNIPIHILDYAVLVVGILIQVGALIRLIWLFLLLRYKFITLKGNFGSETLKFLKSSAREFESKLSEMIFIMQTQHTNEQNNKQELFSPTAPTFTVDNELQYYSKENKYRYVVPKEKTSNVQNGMKYYHTDKKYRQHRPTENF